MSNLKLFQESRIRSAWNEEEEQWRFSVVDVVEALTGSANPTDYLKKLRKRDPDLALFLGTNCPQVALQTLSGKLRKTLSANIKILFRIIQSVPSPKDWIDKRLRGIAIRQKSESSRPHGRPRTDLLHAWRARHH